jgi:hypothetical protein
VIVRHALVSTLLQTPHHVGAHAPKPDHPDPHRDLPTHTLLLRLPFSIVVRDVRPAPAG